MISMRRRFRRHPVLMTAGLALAAVVGLDVIAHALWLLVLGGLAAGAYVIVRDRARAASGRRTGPAPVRPVTPAPTSAHATSRTGGPVLAQLAATGAERDQLAARVADLERQLAEARDMAHAAWDAAASVTNHRPDRDDDAIARLLSAPLSGARPLGGPR